MTSAAASVSTASNDMAPSPSAPNAAAPRGRLLPPTQPFVHPLFDYLIIGGGLTLVVLLLAAVGRLPASTTADWFPALFLASNGAHFAASTVRLYSKPGALREFRFLTMGLPLTSIAVLTVALLLADSVGRWLMALYLTWSPFHYAAQAYGLALMYGVRSGAQLSGGLRWLLWITCMTPFLYSFVTTGDAGIGWLVDTAGFEGAALDVAGPAATARQAVAALLAALSFGLPLAVAGRLWQARAVGLPLISYAVILANAIWWLVFDFYQAFVWATVLHGLQYLGIVLVFHVKDRARATGRPHWLRESAWFYGASAALAYLLFYVWPWAYQAVGFSWGAAALVTAAVINLHHFIVDAFIWRLRKPANLALATERAA